MEDTGFGNGTSKRIACFASCGLVTPRVSRVMVGLVVGLQPLVEPSRLGRGSSQQCGPRDAGEAGGVHVWRRPKGGVLGSIATAF